MSSDGPTSSMSDLVKRNQSRAPPRRRPKGTGFEDQPIFLRNCMQMINTCPPEIGGWSENGASIVIRNVELFAQEVLPRSYRHNNLASFIRQLNFYGFRKSKLSPREREAGLSIYHHPQFLRDRPDLLSQIKRSEHFAADESKEVEQLREEVRHVTEQYNILSSKLDELTSLFHQGANRQAVLPVVKIEKEENVSQLRKKRKLDFIDDGNVSAADEDVSAASIPYPADQANDLVMEADYDGIPLMRNDSLGSIITIDFSNDDDMPTPGGQRNFEDLAHEVHFSNYGKTDDLPNETMLSRQAPVSSMHVDGNDFDDFALWSLEDKGNVAPTLNSPLPTMKTSMSPSAPTQAPEAFNFMLEKVHRTISALPKESRDIFVAKMAESMGRNLAAQLLSTLNGPTLSRSTSVAVAFPATTTAPSVIGNAATQPVLPTSMETMTTFVTTFMNILSRAVASNGVASVASASNAPPQPQYSTLVSNVSSSSTLSGTGVDRPPSVRGVSTSKLATDIPSIPEATPLLMAQILSSFAVNYLASCNTNSSSTASTSALRSI